MKFNEILKNARKEKGLSRKALAEKVGMSPVTIEKYEQGVNEPSPNNASMLAYALGVEALDFVGALKVYKNWGKTIGEIVNIEAETLTRIVEKPSLYPSEYFSNVYQLLVRTDQKALSFRDNGVDHFDYKSMRNSTELLRQLDIMYYSLRHLMFPRNMKIDNKEYSKQESANLYTDSAYKALDEIIKILNPDYFKDDKEN